MKRQGIEILRLERDGAGTVIDASEKLGLAKRHDLSAIPQSCRVMKLHRDGEISESEEHGFRSLVQRKVVQLFQEIPSNQELRALGYPIVESYESGPIIKDYDFSPDWLIQNVFTSPEQRREHAVLLDAMAAYSP